MKRARFTEEQIIGVLTEKEAGAKAADRLRNPDQLSRSHVAHTAPQGVNLVTALDAAG